MATTYPSVVGETRSLSKSRRAAIIQNEARRNRFVKGLEGLRCDFCNYADKFRQWVLECPVHFGRQWVVAQNPNPIFAGQSVHIPQDDHIHGFDDALLARYPIDLVCEEGGAMYVSPTPSSGRSQVHLHMNRIPPDVLCDFDLPDLQSGETFTYEGVDLVRVTCDDFTAIEIQGETGDVADALITFHEFHNLQIVCPYNLLVYRDDNDDVVTLIVPRAAELSQNAGQKLAGFEFLTGLLSPAPERFDVMTLEMRAAAFKEVTLSASRFDDYFEQLTTLLATSPAGV